MLRKSTETHKSKIFLLGASGHARAIVDVIRAEEKYQIVGFLDSFKSVGEVYCNLPILGQELDLYNCIDQHNLTEYMIAIGDNYQRYSAAQRLQNKHPSLNLATTIHPSAVIASDVTIGLGTVIMPHATVMSGCRIGQGCILNTGSSLDHDSIMEDFSSLAPGVTTGGNVTIKKRTSIGLGANLIHRVTIGSDTVIGAGSLVLKDISSNVVAYGSPCQVIHLRAIAEKYL